MNTMKKLNLIAALFCFSPLLFAQEEPEPPKTPEVVKVEKDRSFGVTADIFTDLWQEVPDGIDTRFLQQGLNFGGMFSNRFGKSAFSIAIGPVIGVHNFYSNGSLLVDTSGVSAFFPLKDGSGNDLSYKRNKLTLVYLDFPLEFRMKTKSKVLASIGFKAGFMIGNHTKYKGVDPSDVAVSTQVKYTDLPNIESYRYGVQLRLGYKNVSFFGFYSLSDVFKADAGPTMYPVSVGLSLRPF
jgi:hypothetical protein